MRRRPRIVWDAVKGRWFVVIGTGRRRKTRSFPTLLDAENYITRELCPDEVEAS